jgi:hypothetical protein
MKTVTIAAIILAAAPLSITPAAFGAEPQNHAYLTDRNGKPVEVRTGGCLRSRYWTNARIDAHCKSTWNKMAVQTRPAR